MSTSLLSEIVACPHCLSRLVLKEGRYDCGVCHSQFEIVHGVTTFASRPDYHYAEVPEEWMSRFVELARVKGWMQAFEQLRGELAPEYAAHICQNSTDVRRAAWKFITALPSQGVALDLGCGWGALSLGLARSFRAVVSMDLDAKRVEAAGLQALDVGIDNLIPVHGGDTSRLPFQDEVFDLVVLNGVLEYAGTLQRGNPRRIQEGFLREVHRILKPSGQAYVGIENRFYFRHFLAWPDPHTKLRFGTLWPRPLAHLHSLIAQGHPYRHYTYGHWGYRSLMRRAGFRDLSLYCPYPQYYGFHTIVDLSAPETFRYAFDPSSRKGRCMLALAARMQLLKVFGPGFAIVGTKGQSTTPFYKRLADEITRGMGRDAHPLELSHLRVCQGNKVAAYLKPRGGEAPKYIALLSLNESDEARLESSASRLRRIRSHPKLSERIKALLPVEILHGRLDHQSYYVQTCIHGVPCHRIVHDEAAWTSLGSQATDILTELHLSTSTNTRMVGTLWETKVVAPIHSVRQHSPTSMHSGPFVDVVRYLEENLKGQELPLVLAHRDFVPLHVFAEPATFTITGIIDWELADTDQLPLYDLVNFCVGWRQEKTGEKLWICYRDFLHAASEPTSFERQLLTRYCEKLQMPLPVRRGLLLLYWFLLVQDKIRWQQDCKVGESLDRYYENLGELVCDAIAHCNKVFPCSMYSS